MPYAKSFGNSTNNHDSSRNMFANVDRGNCLSIFLITLPKHVLIGWKFHWDIKTLKQWHIEIKHLLHFTAHWQMLSRLIFNQHVISEIRATAKHTKKGAFFRQRESLYFGLDNFLLQHFYYILWGSAPKSWHTFCLDKCLSCYIFEVLVNSGVSNKSSWNTGWLLRLIIQFFIWVWVDVLNAPS